MSLVLEIEHLLGVSFAAISPASSSPDWPPQPDRVFSALVAAWGARGELTHERSALEWLEAQPPPELAASGGGARTAATVFVPPNDPQTGRVGDTAVMPSSRRRQPRRFPAFRPDDPVVRLVWRDVDADGATLTALNALAADTPYVGHSASLTRCRFGTAYTPDRTIPARRRIYKGRLTELKNGYDARPQRRPSPGENVRSTPYAAVEPASTFAGRWLVLEHVEGEMPDLRASALVAKALRGAVMSGYRQTAGEAAIPALVSGHAADGAPFAEPHLAIAPLAFVGPRHADGSVFGFALIPPGDGTLLDDAAFQNAMRKVAPWSEKQGRRELRLTADGFDLTLSLSSERGLRSLDPAPYIAVARTWATCTPIVLDRHLKEKDNSERDAEIEESIRRACVNIGLPEPKRIAAAKHSAVAGAPPAYPSGRGPRWTRWCLPQSLASRRLTHAVLQFDTPVRGPVILGAGRFCGLGLCRPLDAQKGA